MTALPERTLVQRLEALAKGTEVRTKRANLKRDLKAGKASLRHILQSPPEYVETMKLFDALLAVPSYGKVKTGKVFDICRISPSKTIGGMTERQRAQLIDLMRS